MHKLYGSVLNQKLPTLQELLGSRLQVKVTARVLCRFYRPLTFGSCS